MLLTGAHFIMSLFDLKQQILTRTPNSNTFIGNQRNKRRKAQDSTSSDVFYTNPLLRVNTPDPGVTQLVDGSGWVLVATTNNASREYNSSAFPIYFSKGKLLILVFTKDLSSNVNSTNYRPNKLAASVLGIHPIQLASMGPWQNVGPRTAPCQWSIHCLLYWSR